MKSKLTMLARQVAVSAAALVAVMLCATLSYAWTGPTQTAPGGNVATPLNVSGSAQTRTAALTLGSGASTVVVSNGGLAANTFCLGNSCITEWPSQGNTVPPGTLCGAWVSGSANLGNNYTSCQGLGRAQCPAGYLGRVLYEANGVYMQACYKL